ncbi:MAG: hypothetical protein JWQ18_1283 [Conexibacter sp.]|nr:hypothetical protein [Conexibacter sp.]
MNDKLLGLLVGGLTLAATASPAYAAKVSVEIEGQSVTMAPTVVDTVASVSKAGGASCSGAVPATALDAAVGGDWDGPSYGVTRITTETHPFVSGGSSWAVYVNGRFINDTVCDHALADGDKLLFWWSDAFAGEGYDEPLLLSAAATATPGTPFAVTASETTTAFDPDTYEGTTTIAPSSGATVSGGTSPVTTGVSGTASVTVGGGPYTLVVTKANRAPARIAGCATNGADGFCGTTAGVAPPPAAVAPCVTNGSDGRCGSPDKLAANAAITAVSEGKKYKKGGGPRQLAGKVADDPSGIADVRLRLTRNDKGACATYDGKTEKFKTIKKCGAEHGTWFSVGAKQDFTYLLPSKLGRGRYVLDVEVTDKAGNTTKSLARGTSRVVFTVA